MSRSRHPVSGGTLKRAEKNKTTLNQQLFKKSIIE
jgi:hypothetical protein